MGLYPDFPQNVAGPGDEASAQVLPPSHLFSAPFFETTNDQLLREMNERARRQLQSTHPVDPEMFNLSASPSPQKQRSRFAVAHRRQFAKMDSIASHPAAQLHPRLDTADTQATLSSPKRRPGLLESPSKRQRNLAGLSYIGSAAGASPILKGRLGRQPLAPAHQTNRLATGTAFDRAVASSGSLRGAYPSKPDSRTQRTQFQTPSRPRTLPQSQSHMNLSPTRTDLPSYARPTQATIRRSQSSRVLNESKTASRPESARQLRGRLNF